MEKIPHNTIPYDKRKTFLSKEHAKNITELMGYEYSHHDEYVIYEDDNVYQCYFYPGVCHYTFKLNMITGEVRLDSTMEKMIELSDSLTDMLKELVVDDSITKMVTGTKNIVKKKSDVLEYIKNENIELIKL